MNIFPNIKPAGLAAYLEKEKTLIIGDLHLGYEESITNKGVLLPRVQIREIIDELKKILKELRPAQIVIMGDLLHEFGTISGLVWKDAATTIRCLKEAGPVILLKGNHDKMLSSIGHRMGIKVKDYLVLGEQFLCHGDRLFNNKDYQNSKTVIIAHEHPAISIRDGSRIEHYKCFLVGKYKSKNLVVIPSFSQLTCGTDLLSHKPLSPFLFKLERFRVFVVSDDYYDFGTIKDLKKLIKNLAFARFHRDLNTQPFRARFLIPKTRD